MDGFQMVALLLGGKITASDAEFLFDEMQPKLISQAIEGLKGCDYDARNLWVESMYIAEQDVFGWSGNLEIEYNVLDSDVKISAETASEIENYETKAKKFAELTGFDIETY